MSFLFRNKRAKQFNFKPVYLDPKKEEQDNDHGFSLLGKNYSEDMYKRYDRIPFSELEKQGKKRVKALLWFSGTIGTIIYYKYEEIVEFFTQIL